MLNIYPVVIEFIAALRPLLTQIERRNRGLGRNSYGSVRLGSECRVQGLGQSGTGCVAGDVLGVACWGGPIAITRRSSTPHTTSATFDPQRVTLPLTLHAALCTLTQMFGSPLLGSFYSSVVLTRLKACASFACLPR